MRNPLTLRGWIAAILIGALSAAITVLAIVQIRHWLLDEAQLHQIVQLIQSGQIRITPPPGAAANPAASPAPPPK